MNKTPIIATAAALLLSACATNGTDVAANAAPDGRDCFRNESINGFSRIDDDTIKVSVGASRDYALSAPRLGQESRWNNVIAIEAEPSGWICTGNGLGVRVLAGDRGFERPFYVRSITRIEEEDQASAEDPNGNEDVPPEAYEGS